MTVVIVDRKTSDILSVYKNIKNSDELKKSYSNSLYSFLELKDSSIFEYEVGISINNYDKMGKRKSNKTLVDEGLLLLPHDKKIDSQDNIVDMTSADLFNKNPDYFHKIIVSDNVEHLVQKTKKELYDEGHITKEEYNLYIDSLRKSEYEKKTDPLILEKLVDILINDSAHKDYFEQILNIKNNIKETFPKV